MTKIVKWGVALLAVGLAGATGAAEPLFVKAAPVWAAGRESERNVFLRFRARFERTGADVPELRLTASTAYRAFLNGAFLGYGPARSIKGEALVDAWPLAAARQGANDLEIEVCSYNEKNSFQYHAQDGFLQAEVVCGGKVLLATPSGFTASELSRSTTEKWYSHQRRFPTERWRVGGDEGGRRWNAAPTEGEVAIGAAKGLALAKRTVPYPVFALNEAFRPVAGGEKGLFELPFIDSGFIGAKVVCEEPVTVTVRFEEALVKGVLSPLRNGDADTSWHAMHNTVTWEITRPGEYTLESFEPYALKYAKVEVSGGKGRVEKLWVRQVRSPAIDRVRFTSSDSDLTAIFAAARNSLSENAIDFFTDCPGRERSGWLCDSRFSATTMALLTGETSVERQHLLCYARSKGTGSIPPNVTSGCFPGENLLPTYLLWFVIQCDDYVRRAGPGETSATFKQAVKERIFGNIEYLKRSENKEGLLENLPGWVFVEWSRANDFTKGVNYAVNALWSRALERAGEMYDRADWREQAKRVKDGVLRQSFDGAYFRDHALRDKNGALVAQGDRTETCQYYQFVFGIATPESHPALWKKMLTAFGPSRTADGLFPSDMFFGRFLRLQLLAQAGLYDQAVKEAKTYFAPMARESGTLWEFVDGHDSRCHAFGSYVAAVLLPGALGICEIDRLRRVVVLDEKAVRVDAYDLTLPTAEGDLRVVFDRKRGGCGGGFVETALPRGWRRFRRNRPTTFAIDASRPGRILPNVQQTLVSWNPCERACRNVKPQPEYNPLEFVRYMEVMGATGGNAQRDCFRDPSNRNVLDDYDFPVLIAACRDYLRLGIKPYLKLGNVPQKLSSNISGGHFHMNIRPPDDYAAYGRYMKACAEALIAAFGREELKTWRYAVLTEYENAGWFEDVSKDPEKTFRAYCRLYETTVDSFVRTISPDLTIGVHAMAVTEGLWDERRFFGFVAERKLPLKFATASFYDARPGRFTSGLSLPKTIAHLRTAAEQAGLTNLYYAVDEGRLLWGATRKRANDNLLLRIVGDTYQAAYDARIVKQLFESRAEYFAAWGYFGGFAPQFEGLPSVAFHVARESAKFGGMRELPVGVSGEAPTGVENGAVAALTPKGDRLQVMAYAFTNALFASGRSAVKVRVALPAAWRWKKLRVVRKQVDDEANWFDEWRAERKRRGIGDDRFNWSPDDPGVLSGLGLIKEEDRAMFRRELEPKFRACARLKSVETTEPAPPSGEWTLERALPYNAVLFVTLEPR